MFGTVEDAWNMGAVAVGATIYFGSFESNRQIVEVAKEVTGLDLKMKKSGYKKFNPKSIRINKI
jgi:hypothetical protein